MDHDLLCVAADTADAMGCVDFVHSDDIDATIHYIRKCLFGESCSYHPGHRDCNMDKRLNFEVDDARFDPRGIRYVITQEHAEPWRFWVFKPAEKRARNRLLLYRWQRGGPTVILKTLERGPLLCDFGSSTFPDRPLGERVLLAMVWPLIFASKERCAAILARLPCTRFERLSLASLCRRLQYLREHRKVRRAACVAQLGDRMLPAWSDVLSRFPRAQVPYVLCLHTFHLAFDNVVETYLAGLRFCLEHGLCPFAIGTTLLQVLLMRTRHDNASTALADLWKCKLCHVDGQFSGRTDDTFYEYRKRGRNMPHDCAYDRWPAVLERMATSAGADELCEALCMDDPSPAT